MAKDEEYEDTTYLTRKFDGKVYSFSALRQTKAQAGKEAKKFRGKGMSARVVKLPGYKHGKRAGWVYAVYTRD